MCAIAGPKQACLRSYLTANPASATTPAKIVGVDPETGGTVVVWFKGGCTGSKPAPNTYFFLDAVEFTDVKDALDGPGRVNFHGLPVSGTTKLTNVAWQELA